MLQLNPIILSASALPKTSDILKSALDEKVAPGFVIGIWQRSRPNEGWVFAAGNRRWVPTGLPLATDTPFDLASLTKVCGTATLAATLVQRGWISWDDPIDAFLPEARWTRGGSDPIRLSHLLSHTSGLPAWKPYYEMIQERFAPKRVCDVPIRDRKRLMRELVLSTPVERAPEVQAVYSDVGFLTLGFALEEVCGMSLDQAISHFVWNPMGIRGFEYRMVTASADRQRDERFAATEESAWRGGVLQGQVHDDNCWSMGGVAAHAGVFGTALDVLQFSFGLLHGFLSPAVLKAAWSRVSLPSGCERTLGWDTPSGENPSSGHHFSPGSVGHLGFTGTSLWIDPVAGVAVTVLSNRVHPSRENDRIRMFRPKIHDAIREDLGTSQL